MYVDLSKSFATLQFARKEMDDYGHTVKISVCFDRHSPKKDLPQWRDVLILDRGMHASEVVKRLEKFAANIKRARIEGIGNVENGPLTRNQ